MSALCIVDKIFTVNNLLNAQLIEVKFQMISLHINTLKTIFNCVVMASNTDNLIFFKVFYNNKTKTFLSQEFILSSFKQFLITTFSVL